MNKFIPAKVLKDSYKQKPWIDRKVRASMRKKAKLYTKIKKTGKEKDISKYRLCKRATQKIERNIPEIRKQLDRSR